MNLSKYYAKYNMLMHFLLFFIQSGDVHPHPGPGIGENTTLNSGKCKGRTPKYPCVVCSKGVTERSKAISCDSCDKWIHIKCTGQISPSTYDKMCSGDIEISFLCQRCLLDQLPFRDTQ